MIDLDLLSKKKESYLNDTLFQRITQYIIDSLMKFIKFKKEEEIYVVFIRKKTIKYSDKHEAYKDGIHILLPGLKVSKQFKKYFIKKPPGDRRFCKSFWPMWFTYWYRGR